MIYANDAEYLEGNKGVIALYELSKTTDLEVFTTTLKEWIQSQNGAYVYFKGFYDLFIPELESNEKEKAIVWFEKVI